jgi:hypothetical protein
VRATSTAASDGQFVYAGTMQLSPNAFALRIPFTVHAGPVALERFVYAYLIVADHVWVIDTGDVQGWQPAAMAAPMPMMCFCFVGRVSTAMVISCFRFFESPLLSSPKGKLTRVTFAAFTRRARPPGLQA